MSDFNYQEVIAAVGGLGTAAAGLVDASKVFWGGVNRAGFTLIESAVAPLAPDPVPPLPPEGLTQQQILDTLRANWFNGVALADQKAQAKSLIKLKLSPANAALVAGAANVNAADLSAIATSQSTGTPLSPTQTDFFNRFDQIVTTLLDRAYQRADQRFRNTARFAAMIVSVLFALVGAMALGQHLGKAFISESGWPQKGYG